MSILPPHIYSLLSDLKIGHYYEKINAIIFVLIL
jgi:hypothetical protein